MSRLIDADKLIETIKQEVDMKQRYSPKGFINVINSTPTAYNMDKVVEQLEVLKEDYDKLQSITIDETLERCYEAKVDSYRCAINLVKAGGINE